MILIIMLIGAASILVILGSVFVALLAVSLGMVVTTASFKLANATTMHAVDGGIQAKGQRWQRIKSAFLISGLVQILQVIPFVSFFISDMYLKGIDSVDGVEYFFLAIFAVLSIRAFVYILFSSDLIPIRSDALRLLLCSSVILIWSLWGANYEQSLETLRTYDLPIWVLALDYCVVLAPLFACLVIFPTVLHSKARIAVGVMFGCVAVASVGLTILAWYKPLLTALS
ncbi:hypothetical protein PH5382_03846 [Phaeobacter sp. CECT 5382]|uniref:hypothetical protein n=1 Tax=Phaeobacter sp. CECT 5382 TaxID=1712645 RepID=UPI0006DA7326|nr:hypothetical protein [Phaeobacter sp. CECT 5382]CUH89891.1 hypothetical protein PH5382_03846 [Phaeobacter sp. CECT 5382]